jgi:3-deoxy-manno-octulosonate cytidylyltransferase (CMP-KDO synthetase)
MLQLSPLIIIPARLASSRLPNKPLAMIGDKPMIAHVIDRAKEANLGPVLVACDSVEIADAVQQAGGLACLTKPDHPSGSDRIYEALCLHDPENRHDIIINCQGDLPNLDPSLLQKLVAPLASGQADITTLATAITREEEHQNPSVVKVVMSLQEGADTGRALYFTRTAAPYGEGIRYHHIGVYAYRRDALKRFVSLPPSPLELREKLEQLRALEAGMRISVCVVNTTPLGIDTPQDLARAREIMHQGN